MCEPTLSQQLFALSKEQNSYDLFAMARQAEALERTPEQDVRDFHKKFDHPAPDGIVPLLPDEADFRGALINEEAEEAQEELMSGNLAGIGAECADLIYVAVGTLVAYGLPLQPFWDAIHTANMTKEPNPKGGKPIKPDSWVKPDFPAILLRIRQCNR